MIVPVPPPTPAPIVLAAPVGSLSAPATLSGGVVSSKKGRPNRGLSIVEE